MSAAVSSTAAKDNNPQIGNTQHIILSAVNRFGGGRSECHLSPFNSSYSRLIDVLFAFLVRALCAILVSILPFGGDSLTRACWADAFCALWHLNRCRRPPTPPTVAETMSMGDGVGGF
eukprot:scaffold3225_cov65-Cyclotella_meneghiniana.AAC.15